jgi:hypothetical protein
MQALGDSILMSKLLQKKVNEVSLVNLDEGKLENLKFLNPCERKKLMRSLK